MRGVSVRGLQNPKGFRCRLAVHLCPLSYPHGIVIHTHVYIHTSMYMYVYIYIYTYMCVCVGVGFCVYLCQYVHVYTHIDR